MLAVLFVLAAALLCLHVVDYLTLPKDARAAAAFALPQRRTLAQAARTRAAIARLLPSEADVVRRHDSGRIAPGSVCRDALAESPLVRQTISGAKVKRVLDLGFASALIVFTAPLLAAAAIAIKCDSPGPVFYRQTRVGHDGKRFRLWKLRTMTVDAEAAGAVWAAADDQRVTRVGAVLRRTRIDEIPQCFNVIGGAMSFVGPRPERPEFTELLGEAIPHYECRHLVKPGLTGWAQVNHPYGASVADAAAKLEYELYYIQHFSLVLDACIVMKTVRVALTGRGSR